MNWGNRDCVFSCYITGDTPHLSLSLNQYNNGRFNRQDESTPVATASNTYRLNYRKKYCLNPMAGADMFGQLPGGSGCENPGNGGDRIDVYSCCRLL